MEGPIHSVPIEHVVPKTRPNADQRKQRGDAQREHPFTVPDLQNPTEPPPAKSERPTPIHEDGVGERIDVTA
ncbi:MAG: hypothetical protein HZA53_18335 [Planctomycetes bacterium]|nr:hypothetical protein [Planctomycetota bacterium]